MDGARRRRTRGVESMVLDRRELGDAWVVVRVVVAFAVAAASWVWVRFEEVVFGGGGGIVRND